MWITWKVMVRETCFCEKIRVVYTLSWVFQKYFNFRQSLTRPGTDTSLRQFHKSAIGQHLLDNAQCASHYNKDKFSVLARARTPFHLSVLEATFIKSLNPLLCKQKEFVTPWRSPEALELPLVDCSNLLTGFKWHRQPMTSHLFLSPKPFLIGHFINQRDLFFSVYKPARKYLHFIRTISLEECQTKSFGMNLLLHAIFKFCTTKCLFKSNCSDITVSSVFRHYFNFVPMLKSRNVDHVRGNCSWDMFLWKTSSRLHTFMSVVIINHVPCSRRGSWLGVHRHSFNWKRGVCYQAVV